MKLVAMIAAVVTLEGCGVHAGSGGTLDGEENQLQSAQDRGENEELRGMAQRFELSSNRLGSMQGEAQYRTLEASRVRNAPKPILSLSATNAAGEFVTVELEYERGGVVLGDYSVSPSTTSTRVMFSEGGVQHDAKSGVVKVEYLDRLRISGRFSVETDDGVKLDGGFTGKWVFDCSTISPTAGDEGGGPGTPSDGAAQWVQDTKLDSAYCKDQFASVVP